MNSKPHVTNNSSTLDTIMSIFSSQSKQLRPSQVQTNLETQASTSLPASTKSGSSVASNSLQGSPIMSPDTAVLTTSSSIQASPEPVRSVDGDGCPSNFQLPESIVSRKASSNSLGQSLMSQSNAIPETPGSGIPSTPNQKSSLIRRISSRASKRLTSGRRQSSVAPASRDASVGPCLLRRRSDSNATAPPDFPPVALDSESDGDDKDEARLFRALGGHDASVRSTSAGSTDSIPEEPNTMIAPTVPYELQRGTWLTKYSAKKSQKRVCLVYDPDSSKLTWDKKKSNKFVHLDEVLAVRSGSDIRQYSLDLKRPDAEDQLFSIIYSVPNKTDSKILHFMTETPAICHVWVKFLDDMLRHRQELMTSLMAFNSDAIAQYWQSEMTKQFGDSSQFPAQEELDIDGVKNMCQKLHIYTSQAILEAKFHQSDVRRRERLSYSEFADFLRRMNQRPEVQRIIRSIAEQPEIGITMDEFLTFLRDQQGEDVDSNREAWEREFIRLVQTPGPKGTKTNGYEPLIMSEAAFIGYLTSKHNGPLREEPQEYTLDRPMNEYFISSSHNTYLTGRQLAGTSSVEGYISALVQGCRCVEIDCWNGPNGEPKVTHGQTLTSNVSFREVCVVIQKYAFVKTLFPLWISLEVRCNEEQQRSMARIMREVFGSQLIEEPLDPNSGSLPSPSELLECILVKVKKPKDLAAPEAPGRRRGNSLTSPLIRPTLPEAPVPTPSQSLPQSPMLTPTQSLRRPSGKNRVNTITEGKVTGLVSGHTSDNEGSDTASYDHDSTVKALGELGVYCAGVKFHGFDAPEAKEFNHIFSFQESTLQKNTRTKDMKMALDLHNMRYLMRIYPDPTRVSSSNFDPIMYWRRGVQMAALNWQSNDVAMQVNRAMFEGGTDSSGYVLKPPELRNIQVLPFHSERARDVSGGKKERNLCDFGMEVMSAQQLMRPAKLPAHRAMHPYVEVEVFDGRANCIRDARTEGIVSQDNPLKASTDIVRENGFNPMFNDGQLRFKITTKYPEFIFVKFTVKLSSNGEVYDGRQKDMYGIASCTVKLSNLKSGYRTLPLENERGEQYLFSTLFCRFQVTPIAKTMVEAPRRKQEVSKFKSLGGKVFGRIGNSPRNTSLDMGSVEKTSIESSV